MVANSKIKFDFLFWNFLLIQLIISFFPKLIFIQALTIIIAGIYFGHKKLDKRFLYIITLLAGCDIYYRQLIVAGMTSIIPWEFSKYCSIILCFTFYIFNSKYIKQRYSSLFNLFIILCIPSVIIGCFSTNMTYLSIKNTISGYFSGILSLYAICKAFDGISINPKDIKKIAKYFFLGMIPTSVFLLKNLLNISSITFSNNSSYEFAGYGPIHVSTSISFLISLLFITNYIFGFWKNKKTIYLVCIFYLILMILTFSRSGLFILLITFGIIFFTHTKIKNLMLPLAFIYTFIYYMLFPTLNDTPYAAIEKRFSEATPGSRIKLIKSDLEIWFNNPVFGVGLGLAKKNRNILVGSTNAKSHTEYTRFLAEQGIFGLGCIFILFSTFINRLMIEKIKNLKIWITFLIMFPALYFLPSAFSTFLPAFSLGLALLKVDNEIRL